MKTILALSLLSLLGCSGSSLPEGLPLRYEYRLSWTMRYPVDWYLVETTDQGVTRILACHDNGEVTIVRAPEDIFARIDKLVRDAHLERLKENYKPHARILDGKSWSISIRYPDKQSIYSSGYHAWPKEQLREGIKAINALLQQLVDNAPGDDILGTGNYEDLRGY